jgi:hypothetical protein
MSFQKDLPPPGIYDGACAIVKSNPSPCIWKALRLISADERHQQTITTTSARCIGPHENKLNHGSGQAPDLAAKLVASRGLCLGNRNKIM